MYLCVGKKLLTELVEGVSVDLCRRAVIEVIKDATDILVAQFIRLYGAGTEATFRKIIPPLLLLSACISVVPCAPEYGV